MATGYRMGRCGLALLMNLGLVGAAAAGPPLLDMAEPAVTAGEAVDVTVLGEPGHAYAVAMSRTNRGLEVQGWALQLGPDAVVLATGQLDARGRAVVTLHPEFGGRAKLYLQAVTAPTERFEGLVATPGKALRNLAGTLETRVLALPEGGRPMGTLAGGGSDGPRLVALAGPGGGREEQIGCAACVGAGALGDGVVTTPKLADGAVTAAKLAPGTIAGQGWALGGNGGTDPASQFVGTTDDQPLEVRVNGARALRLEPGGAPDAIYGSGPNLLGGLGANGATAGVVGATVAGGGGSTGDCGGPATACPNRVTDHFGTIGGGAGNQAGDDTGTLADQRFATVSGGRQNTASGEFSVVGGGRENTANFDLATVGGGDSNVASGFIATVGGGDSNMASGSRATVGGGQESTASGTRATVGGGRENTASGQYSTVPGGRQAVASLFGQLAYAAGPFVVAGDAQSSLHVLRRETTDGTMNQELFLDGSAAHLVVAPNTTLAFDGLVVARRDTGTADAHYIRGMISNNDGTTALVGTPTIEDLNGGVDFAVSVVADDGNDALVIQGTGVAGQTIRWVATVRTVEVGH